MEMFSPVDPGQEAAILAASETRRGKKGPDLSIRTNTQWFKLTTHYGECAVENHEENVNAEDADPTDRKRMVYDIEGISTCRWCFVAGGS